MMIVATVADIPLPSRGHPSTSSAPAAFAWMLDDIRNQLYRIDIAARFIKTGPAAHAHDRRGTAGRLVDRSDPRAHVLCSVTGRARWWWAITRARAGILSMHLLRRRCRREPDDPGGSSQYPQSRRAARKLDKISMNRRKYTDSRSDLARSHPQALNANSLKVTNIDHLVPHQADARISNRTWKTRRPDEEVLADPRPLQQYVERFTADRSTKRIGGRLKKGDLIAIMAISASMTWAAP